MKLRCLAVLAFGASLFTGCPENTYPAGERDAFPLTDESLFKRDEHDKGVRLREQLEKAAPAEREAIIKQLNDPDRLKKEAEEVASVQKWQPYIRAILARLFGSPEHPTMPVTQDQHDIKVVFTDPSLKDVEEPGSPLDVGRKLYKQHCMHCHGFYGFGDGPTANFLNPKPRDFRYGKVKFTSTEGSARVVHEDLVRTIAQGVQGTFMPAFGPSTGIPAIGIFAGHAGPPGFDVDAVASYVEMLLMRGSVEQQLLAKWNEDGELNPENAQGAVNTVLDDWKVSRDKVVKAASKRGDDFEKSADQGAILFGYGDVPETAKKDQSYGKAGCVKCHGLHGLGVDSPAEDQAMPDQLNDYKLPSRPANLTLGVYRGGRRPVDLYRRLHAGIKGTPMPGQAGNLAPNEIWNVVDFVYRLGTPKPEKAE